MSKISKPQHEIGDKATVAINGESHLCKISHIGEAHLGERDGLWWRMYTVDLPDAKHGYFAAPDA